MPHGPAAGIPSWMRRAPSRQSTGSPAPAHRPGRLAEGSLSGRGRWRRRPARPGPGEPREDREGRRAARPRRPGVRWRLPPRPGRRSSRSLPAARGPRRPTGRGAEAVSSSRAAGARWRRRRPGLASRVGLPSRRSSPTGLPVTAGSPKTSSRSSRSWNASPSGRPKADRGPASSVGPGRGGQGGAEVERALDGVLGRLVAADPPGPGHRLGVAAAPAVLAVGRPARIPWAAPRMSRYWPTLTSRRTSSNTALAAGGAPASSRSL